MQHILNPDLFIENLIKSSKIIRILEPINWPTNNAHPHTYTFEYFSSKFQKYENNLKVYKGNSIVNFHSSDCVYGTINIEKVL